MRRFIVFVCFLTLALTYPLDAVRAQQTRPVVRAPVPAVKAPLPAVQPPQPATTPPQPAQQPFTMRIETKGFDVEESNIRALLVSAGGELWKFFPDYKIEPIVVLQSADGPIVLHQRNVKGEVVVLLNTTGTLWSQYSYQFAHELCHVLSGFKPTGQNNRWFEETLCETASLYTMRAMARTWRQTPPFPNWRDYRDSLSDYCDDVVRSRGKLVEIYMRGMPEFYRANRGSLEADPCLRELNGTMAVPILQILEKEPSHWEAVRWLNSPGHREGESFGEYLRAWHAAVPPRHQPWVKEVADLYGVQLSPAPSRGYRPQR